MAAPRKTQNLRALPVVTIVPPAARRRAFAYLQQLACFRGVS